MDTDTLRDLIRARLRDLGITPYRAAGLAGIPESTVRLYLSGSDLTAGRVLALAAAVGLAVTAAPAPGYAVAPGVRGRPTGKTPQKSATLG